jgi:hypothetical protein
MGSLIAKEDKNGGRWDPFILDVLLLRLELSPRLTVKDVEAKKSDLRSRTLCVLDYPVALLSALSMLMRVPQTPNSFQ